MRTDCMKTAAEMLVNQISTDEIKVEEQIDMVITWLDSVHKAASAVVQQGHTADVADGCLSYEI